MRRRLGVGPGAVGAFSHGIDSARTAATRERRIAALIDDLLDAAP